MVNVLIKGFGVRAGGAEISDNLVSGQTQELTNTTGQLDTKNKVSNLYLRMLLLLVLSICR